MPGGLVPGSRANKFSKAFWDKARAKFGNNKFIFHENTYAGINSRITVTCNSHGEFERQANNFLASPVGCPKCVKGNRRSLPVIIDQFIDQATEVHDGKYTYPHEQLFENIHSNVTITCNIHGDFTQRAIQHLDGRGCKKCNLAAGTLRYTTETFIDRAKKVHQGRKYDYSKTVFISGHEKLTVICPSHGNFLVEASSHLSGRECNDCRNQKATKTTEEFIEKGKSIHGDKYQYDKCIYTHSKNNVIITCPKHGDFEQRPNCHLKGSGCKRCAAGSNSRKAVQWLEYMQVRTGLAIEHSVNGGEHYIEEIMPGKTRADIRVDGYNADTKTVFEFMGDSYHGNPKRYSEKMDEMHWCVKGKTYQDLYDATVNRTSWLRSLNYTVVEIWEMDWDRAVKAVVKIQRAFRKKHRTLS